MAGDRTGLWLKHYSIVPTGASTGIVEVMTDAVSLDSLKKSKGFKNVASHLIHAHGPAGSRRHARARRAFVSCVFSASFPSFLLPSAHRRAVGDGVAAMASRRRAVILASMAYPGDGVLVRRSRAKMVSGAMRRLSRTSSTRHRGDGTPSPRPAPRWRRAPSNAVPYAIDAASRRRRARLASTPPYAVDATRSTQVHGRLLARLALARIKR